MLFSLTLLSFGVLPVDGDPSCSPLCTSDGYPIIGVYAGRDIGSRLPPFPILMRESVYFAATLIEKYASTQAGCMVFQVESTRRMLFHLCHELIWTREQHSGSKHRGPEPSGRSQEAGTLAEFSIHYK